MPNESLVKIDLVQASIHPHVKPPEHSRHVERQGIDQLLLTNLIDADAAWLGLMSAGSNQIDWSEGRSV